MPHTDQKLTDINAAARGLSLLDATAAAFNLADASNGTTPAAARRDHVAVHPGLTPEMSLLADASGLPPYCNPGRVRYEAPPPAELPPPPDAVSGEMNRLREAREKLTAELDQIDAVLPDWRDERHKATIDAGLDPSNTVQRDRMRAKVADAETRRAELVAALGFIDDQLRALGLKFADARLHANFDAAKVDLAGAEEAAKRLEDALNAAAAAFSELKTSFGSAVDRLQMELMFRSPGWATPLTMPDIDVQTLIAFAQAGGPQADNVKLHHLTFPVSMVGTVTSFMNDLDRLRANFAGKPSLLCSGVPE